MQPLSVLLLSPDPRTSGGVSAFAETLKAHVKNTCIRSFHVGNRDNEGIGAVPIRLLAAPVKVARLVCGQHVDAVHLNPSFNPRALIRDGLILLALRLAGYKRIIVFFHGWDVRLEKRIRRWSPARNLMVWLLKETSRVIVLAPEFKTALEAMGLDSGRIDVGRVMYNKVQVDIVPSERRRILFMGRFDRRKGVYELLDAFAQLADEFPDLDLVMAGDGKEAGDLRQRAAGYGLQGRVVFAGYVQGEAKAGLLASCTVFALPTLYPEGMPVALLEAMGAGKPVLTTRAGGIRHIVREPDNGLVLEDVTADSVTNALRRLLGAPELCKAMGERNLIHARSFEAATVTAGIECLYQAVAHA